MQWRHDTTLPSRGLWLLHAPRAAQTLRKFGLLRAGRERPRTRAASFGRLADQPAGHDLLPSRIDRWYPQPRDMSDYPVTGTEEIRVGCDEERRWSILRHGGKRRIDLLVVARRQQFQSQ